jgi:hypothetical protein
MFGHSERRTFSASTKTVGMSSGSAERFDLAVDGQPLERLGLELPDPLAGQP